jgi:cobalamin biosynthesis protein CobD/CbiB
MNATITPTIEKNLYSEMNENQSILDLEPLEEEFRPEVQKQGVSVVVGMAYAIVFGLITAMLGWTFGAFFVVAMVAKHFLTKAELAQESNSRPLMHA